MQEVSFANMIFPYVKFSAKLSNDMESKDLDVRNYMGSPNLIV